MVRRNATNKVEGEFQAGDIINVQGTGIISRLIRWVTDYDYSHTAMLCCRLGNGEYMVNEMLAKGILIRPLSVYKGKKIKVFRVTSQNAKELGEHAVLNSVDMIPKAGYDFEKILCLGLFLMPRRLFNRRPSREGFSYDKVRHKMIPKDPYPTFCYYLARIISTIMLMSQWTSILCLFSKDKWLLFTEKVFTQYMFAKMIRGEVSYTEFVKIVEEEWELQKTNFPSP
jgi:hypothetical protein